ncbi:MAG: hypothetical protein HY834_10025 [Devosia nanyangense]|uniref:GlsB/YeaQ/YmgE family stress response membrane protein n=1 Tax=Devosia nanyangense TaxID=1228055 RepID=A0A933L434_9HYPH|nr:hypothetical protein [Devosia nanyangense]
MDWVGLIIQLVAGAVGGYGTGRMAKSMSLGTIGDVIAGLIGGWGGAWLVGLIPGLTGLVSGGGVGYVGQAVAGVIGGGILTAIAGAIKNATMK